jgi:hypothetical protein
MARSKKSKTKKGVEPQEGLSKRNNTLPETLQEDLITGSEQDVLEAFQMLLNEMKVELLGNPCETEIRLFIRTAMGPEFGKRSLIANFIHKSYTDASRKQTTLGRLYELIFCEDKIDYRCLTERLPEEVFSTALHEAGHAVAKLKLKHLSKYITCSYLTALPRKDEEFNVYGFSSANNLTGENIIWNRSVARDYVVMCMSGYVAQKICLNKEASYFDFDSSSRTQSDRQHARNQIEIYAWKRGRKRNVTKWMQKHFRSSLDVVAKEKETILLLARELFRRKFMHGSEIYQLLKIEKPKYDFEVLLTETEDHKAEADLEEEKDDEEERENEKQPLSSLVSDMEQKLSIVEQQQEHQCPPSSNKKNEISADGKITFMKKAGKSDPMALLGLSSIGTKKVPASQPKKCKQIAVGY